MQRSVRVDARGGRPYRRRMASRSKPRTRARAQPRRWLVLGLALLAAAGALWMLVAGEPDTPLGEIDAASRAKLERVLEQSEGEGSR